MKHKIVSICIGCLLLVAGQAALAGNEVFDATKQFIAGSAPLFPTAADFNRDGLPDLAVADTLADSLIVLFNDGDGGLSGSVSVPVGGNPEYIVSGDFNGDGWPDIACAHGPIRDVSLWLNNAGSSFDFTDSIVATYSPWLIAEDFNSDGFTDLAEGSSLLIHYGDSTGCLSSVDTVPTVANLCAAIDFDLNGKMDLISVVHNAEADIITLLQNNGGRYIARWKQAVGARFVNILSADMNNDGLPDIVGTTDESVYSPYYRGAIRVFLSQGDGTFSETVTHAEVDYYSSLTVGDLDADGDEDLILGNKNHYTRVLSLKVFENDGSGLFDSADLLDPAPTNKHLLLVDFDFDTALDLVLCGKGLAILRNTRDGVFDTPPIVPNTVHGFKVVADFDGDDYPDLALANPDDSTVSILLNNRNGGFSPFYQTMISYQQYDFCASDFNADGHMDVAVYSSYDTTALHLLLNSGNGTLLPLYSCSVSNYGGPIQLAYMNDDSLPDVVVANWSEDKLSVALNDSSGCFQSPLETSPADVSFYLAAADIDGDGDTDIIGEQTYLNVFENDGTGGLEVSQSLDIGFNASDLTAADLNGDNMPDLLVEEGNWQHGSLWLLLNDGAGALETPRSILWGGTSKEVVCGDLSGNGITDICVTGSNCDVSVLINRGNAEFEPALGYYAGDCSDPVLADLDQDGDNDLLLTSEDGVKILWNITDQMTSVDTGKDIALPTGFRLSQNYPNPFNPGTTVEYSVPSRSHVRIDVYNVLGRRVRTLVNEVRPVGIYVVQWDGTDTSGKPVASGVYLYRLKTDDHVEAKKMLLVK